MKKFSSKRELDFEQSEDECFEESSSSSAKKRRLKSDQVKALELSFEAENKLEPERKVQLAIELGLDPRQVAIWFQNRRARWKTKQLERDYFSLHSAYDDLQRSYDAVKLHNETLLHQIGEMKAKIVSSDVLWEKEDDGGFGLSLNNESTPFYSNLNIVSSDSATSGVQCEDNCTTATTTTNCVVSSYKMIGNEEDEDNLAAIWPAVVATYSFLGDEDSAPAFNWYYYHSANPWN